MTHGPAEPAEPTRDPEDPAAQPPEASRRFTRRGLLATGAAGAVGGAIAGAVASNQPPAATAGPVLPPSGRRRFVDKVVLITGATSGIGRSAATLFAAEGARVGFCGRREQLGAEVERQIRAAGGEATYLRADVRAEADVERFVDAVAQHYGGLDICFNNAGITIQKPLHEYTSAEFDDVINTDLRGNFYSLKYEIPHLIARGGGVVIATSSTNAVTTTGNKAAYTAAKHGILGLLNSAAFDYADHNIRLNTLIPGTTDTELVRRAAGAMNLPDAVWDTMAATAGRSIPGARRWATPDEIALGALALASDDLAYMRASHLVIDGGLTAYS